MDNFSQEQDRKTEYYVNADHPLMTAERVKARLQEEAEITAREQHEQLGALQQQAGMVSPGDAVYYDAPAPLGASLQSAAGQSRSQGDKCCAAASPGGYQSEKQALLRSLQYRRDKALAILKQCQVAGQEQAKLADRLGRAIQLISLSPDYELLLELLRLKVL